MPYAGPYPYYPPVIVPYGPVYPGVYPIVTTPWPPVVPGGVYIGDPPPGMATVTWCSSKTVHAN